MTITWETPAGLLSTCTVGTVVNIELSAINALEYKLISGELPDGLELSISGIISGTISHVRTSTVYTFVVRASNAGGIRDRTFSIEVPYTFTTSWSAEGFSLIGNTLSKLLINKDYVEIPINANSEYPVTYHLDKASGELPFGLNLDPKGLIYGIPKYIMTPSEAKEYRFTVVATDGVNEYRQNFVFDIIDSYTFTVDNDHFILNANTINLIDLGSTGTVTLSSLQSPQFIGNGNLGTVLCDDRQYLSVKAYDPNPGMGPMVYKSLNTLPLGLTLDTSLGYVYGNLLPQTDYSHTYQFSIEATKTNIKNNETAKGTGTFLLNVVNQFYTNVVWPSANLGVLSEGIASELSVSAAQKDSTWPLNYYVVPPSQLPDGLSLSTSTGNIIGSATTSGNFSFTVAASTCTYQPYQLTWPVLSYPVTFNTFNLQITPVSTEYTSIWAKPFLTPSQRQAWETFISDQNIFLPSVLFRPDDPVFGLQSELKIFLEFGIERVNLRDYASALYQNLYERRLTFGDVKAAIAKDSHGNHIYDAIFVEVIDELDGSKTSIEINGQTYYPGSIDNIRNSLQSITLESGTEIKVDGKHLPKFMTTVAPGQEYGYIKAAVLCYTKPGESNKILNRIKASKFNFNNLDFFIDRLVVLNSLDQTGTTYLVFNKQPIG